MAAPDLPVRIATEERNGALVARITIGTLLGRDTMPAALRLIAALHDIAEDPSRTPPDWRPAGGDAPLRAVVLTGERDASFIAGADIKEMATLTQERARAFITLIHRVCDGLRALPVPVIARIGGPALGGGLEVAASCDLRVAASTARFGMPEVLLGIPSVVEAALLPGLIGWGRTRRLLLTGEIIGADEALAWGLVDKVVPPAALDAAVDAWLDAILAAGPHAVRLQKALLREWESLPLAAAIAAGIPRFTQAWDSDEPHRMMRAFLERKRPGRAT